MFKFMSALSLLAAIYYLHVGITTHKNNRRSKEAYVFLAINISMMIWAFAYAFAYTATTPMEFSFWNKLSAIGWCSFPGLILYLTLAITKTRGYDHPIMPYLAFLPGGAFLFMSVFLFGPGIETPKVISDIFYIGNFIYNFGYLLLGILVMFFWGKRSDNLNHKKQSRIIVISSIIPFLLTLVAQNLLPIVGINPLPSAGQIYTVIMMWGVNYAITHYLFMEIPSKLINKELFNEISDLTFVIDTTSHIIRVNKKVESILGVTESQLINTPIGKIIQDEAFLNHIWECHQLKNSEKVENILITNQDGERIPFDITVTPLMNHKKRNLLGLLIICQDIRLIKILQTSKEEIEKINNELRMTNALLQNKSILDGLTNLYNHQHINELLENEVLKVDSEGTPLCLMMLDIDYFKEVNDHYGHQVGDRVLVEIARLIKETTRSMDYVGRYGGEEFIVIMPGIALEEAYSFAEKTRRTIQQFDFQISTSVTISVGLTQYQHENAKSLVNRADTLLYQAKNNGRNNVQTVLQSE